MSNFTPVWRLKIDSVEYTDLILSNLTVSSGRTDIYQQPVAGYVNLTVINLEIAFFLSANENLSPKVIRSNPAL